MNGQANQCLQKKSNDKCPRKLTVNYNSIFNKQMSLIYPFKFKVIKGLVHKFTAFFVMLKPNIKDLKFKITL